MGARFHCWVQDEKNKRCTFPCKISAVPNLFVSFLSSREDENHDVWSCINNVPLEKVEQIKIGHIVTADLKDDADIEREWWAVSVKASFIQITSR